jgi:hypothetical protein
MSTRQTENYSDKFGKKFMDFEHFKKFPQLKPWVGKEYEKYGVLFIGESHYLPRDSKIHLKTDIWYNSSVNDLSNKEKAYTDTANIISSGNNRKWNSKGHSIFRNIEEAIIERGFIPENNNNLFRYAAFYNFFQRPAYAGSSLDPDNVDKKIALETFNYIMNIIKPKYIMVLSKKPWVILRNNKAIIWDNNKRKYLSDNESISERFPHPGCAWWNKESKKYQLNRDGVKRTGKKKFIEFLINENIFG